MKKILYPQPFILSAVVIGIYLLIVVWNFGTLAEASPPKPSKADNQNLEDIKANQKCIATARPAADRVELAVRNSSPIAPKDVDGYNDFVRCKAWNVFEVQELGRNSWSVDWKTMTLVPSFQ